MTKPRTKKRLIYIISSITSSSITISSSIVAKI